jgi:hypothetical protein
MQGSGGMGVQGYNTGGVIRMQDGRQTPKCISSLPSSSTPFIFFCETMDLSVLQLGQHNIIKNALETTKIKTTNMISAIKISLPKKLALRIEGICSYSYLNDTIDIG